MRAIAGHEATFVPAFMSLFEHFDWKRIGIVSEKSAVPRGIHDALSADARRKGVALAVEACKLPDRHLFVVISLLEYQYRHEEPSFYHTN